MLKKNERGSVTIITLVTILFMLAFLISTYVIVSNRRQAQEQLRREFKTSYEEGLANIDSIYDDIYNKKHDIVEYDVYYLNYDFGDTIFSGTNYINTGIGLFNAHNKNRNFEISFELSDFIYQFDVEKRRNVFMCNQDESGEPYPGFVFQYRDEDPYNFIGIQVNETTTEELVQDWGTTSGKITFSRTGTEFFQDGHLLIDLDNIATFDAPLTFGANLSNTGVARRFCKAALSDINLKLKYTKSEFRNEPLITPTQTGKVFKGWYTLPYGRGEEITSTSQIQDEETTLYASWGPNNYTVAFNANGGTGTMPNQTGFVFGERKALAANTFTNGEYVFAGWNTRPDGKGKKYVDQEEVVNLTSVGGSVVTLYAQWTLSYYAITYNYGTINCVGNNYINTNIPLFSAENKNRDFAITMDINDIEVLPGQDTNRNVILCCQKETASPYPGFAFQHRDNTSKVNLVLQVNIDKVPNKKENWNKTTGSISFAREGTTFYRNDLEFIDIAKMPTHDAPLSIGANIDANGNPRRYCKATLSNINIKLKYYDEEIEDAFTISPTQTGYTFGGWYTAPNGGGTRVTSEAQLPAKIVTLYANWIPQQ